MLEAHLLKGLLESKDLVPAERGARVLSLLPAHPAAHAEARAEGGEGRGGCGAPVSRGEALRESLSS